MQHRVSFINFLNSVPLGWGFLNGSFRNSFELLFDVPSECARHLRDGQADVGLIPVIEYQRIPDLSVLPGIAIASKREVKSVLFVSRKPLSEVRSVALDSSSRTSVALLKLLLEVFHECHGIEYVPHHPEPEQMLESHDAALIIGNPALRIPPGNFTIYDLANEWNRFTGLPFVFAFWAVRGGVDLGDAADIFYQSRREGLEQIESIASLYSTRLHLPREEIRSYLEDSLDYSLDGKNLEGLQLFYSLAEQHGLIDQARALQFYPCSESTVVRRGNAGQIRS